MKAARSFVPILMVAVLLGVFGCGGKLREAASYDAEPQPAPPARAQSMALGRDMAAGEMAALDEVGEAAPNSDPAAMPRPDRYLIKNATATIEADDPRKAASAFLESVQEAGGYISDLREENPGQGSLNLHMTVRVPAAVFDETMTALDSVGRVIDRTITTQDVTEEFVDTESRLRNLKQTEERVLDHLNRTGDLEDILRIERELSNYREQIERLEGRLRFLKNRVFFSTIRLYIFEKAKAGPLTPDESFSTGKVATEAARSLIEFAQEVWTLAIWLGVWAPVWAPVLLLLVWLVRHAHKRDTQKPPESGRKA